MPMKRINLTLAPMMLKDLDRLAAKYGFDRTNAIRYCIRVTCDSEFKYESPKGEEPQK
jgi:hypothetical protein